MLADCVVMDQMCPKSPPSKKINNADLSVSIAGSSVIKVNYVKCLGVIIDESLSWGPHVEYVKKTVSSNLGMLNRIRKCVPQCVACILFLFVWLRHL